MDIDPQRGFHKLFLKTIVIDVGKHKGRLESEMRRQVVYPRMRQYNSGKPRTTGKYVVRYIWLTFEE